MENSCYDAMAFTFQPDTNCMLDTFGQEFTLKIKRDVCSKVVKSKPGEM
jgi:hypothetical protein